MKPGLPATAADDVGSDHFAIAFGLNHLSGSPIV
jgi:hypothetical protein